MKKKLNFVVLTVLLAAFFSCSDDRNPIPSSRVYLKLDLTFKDKELKTIPSYKIYTTKNINTANRESVGFGGVLVVHTYLDEYKAFDIACPYEAKQSVTVSVDEEIRYAVCPVCNTSYDIGFGTGAPNGASRYYLRTYNIYRNTQDELVVSN